MQTGTKDFYAMNMTESQADKFIAKIEADITANLQLLSSKEPNLKEAEQMYLELKSEVDKITVELNDDKSMLEAISRFRNNDSGTKEFRILRTTSNLDKPPKERKQRLFKWLQMFKEVLEHEQRFMTHEEVFFAALKANPHVEKHLKDKGTNFNHAQRTTSLNIIRACGQTRERHKGVLIDYSNKIGLFSWVLDDFTPEARYIKGFMHGSTAHKNGAKVVPVRAPNPKVTPKVQARVHHARR